MVLRTVNGAKQADQTCRKVVKKHQNGIGNESLGHCNVYRCSSFTHMNGFERRTSLNQPPSTLYDALHHTVRQISTSIRFCLLRRCCHACGRRLCTCIYQEEKSAYQCATHGRGIYLRVVFEINYPYPNGRVEGLANLEKLHGAERMHDRFCCFALNLVYT